MTECIFCKISAGKLGTKFLYEDEELVAFDDIRPAAPVHFLIVPKQHFSTLAHVSDAGLIGRMLLLTPKLAAQKDCGVVEDSTGIYGGYKTTFNVGPKGGQEVFHLHLHVIGHPR